jgi:hypothetical protein
MRGHSQQRGPSSWRLSVYVGRDAAGNKRYVKRTVRGERDVAAAHLQQLVDEVESWRPSTVAGQSRSGGRAVAGDEVPVRSAQDPRELQVRRPALHRAGARLVSGRDHHSPARRRVLCSSAALVTISSRAVAIHGAAVSWSAAPGARRSAEVAPRRGGRDWRCDATAPRPTADAPPDARGCGVDPRARRAEGLAARRATSFDGGDGLSARRGVRVATIGCRPRPL